MDPVFLPVTNSLTPLPQDDVGDGEKQSKDKRDPRQDVAVPIPSFVSGVKLCCVDRGCGHYAQAGD